jgi:hypothetical protein
MTDTTICNDRCYGIDDDRLPRGAAALLMLGTSVALWSGLIATIVAALAAA